MADHHAHFRHLLVEDWRQFEKVDLQLHPRLTVVTGANASGKTTLLALLARHFNWTRGYSSSPVRVRSGNEWRIVGKRRASKILKNNQWYDIGQITYGDERLTQIVVPIAEENPATRLQYDLVLPDQQQVPGLFISSHRLASGYYVDVPNIPTTFHSPEQHFEHFSGQLRETWRSGGVNRPPQLAMKETLIAAAVFGSRKNESVDFNLEAEAIWQGFQEVVRKLMPESVGFRALRVRTPDVIVRTAGADYILDEASGGMSAIIEMAWQIFLRSKSSASFTVVMDEPENHLHPSLQRELMPNLLRAFPMAQFVVATHSPFVVTAVEDSTVFVLDYNDRRRIVSHRLDYANKAASADQTLKRVLGLTSTYPTWAVAEYEKIVGAFMTGAMTAERIHAMRKQLSDAGLGEEFPDAVVRIADSAEDSE